MKYNLKNRPTHKWMYENLDKIQVVEWWFRDFEAELRQRFKQTTSKEGYEELIMEILGDKE